MGLSHWCSNNHRYCGQRCASEKSPTPTVDVCDAAKEEEEASGCEGVGRNYPLEGGFWDVQVCTNIRQDHDEALRTKYLEGIPNFEPSCTRHCGVRLEIFTHIDTHHERT